MNLKAGDEVVFKYKLHGVMPNTRARIYAVSEWAYLLDVNGKSMCIPFKIASKYLKVVE